MKIKPYPGRLIFDHLAKTAGQSVNNFLKTSLGDAYVTDNLIGSHRELINLYGSEYSVISAHITFEEPGLDPRYEYITIFREPVDRAISWLYFVINNHTDDDLKYYRTGALKFIETCGQDGKEFIFHNEITNHLCSIYGEKSVDINKRIKASLAILEEYKVWGLYEHINFFINDLSIFLGISNKKSLAILNRTNNKPKIKDIPEETIREIEKLNQVDIEFYNILKARYVERIKSTVFSLPLKSKWEPISKKSTSTFFHELFILISAFDDLDSFIKSKSINTSSIKFSIIKYVDNLIFYINFRRFDRLISRCKFESGKPLDYGTYELIISFEAIWLDGKFDIGFECYANLQGDLLKLSYCDKAYSFSILKDNDLSSKFINPPANINLKKRSPDIVSVLSDGSGILNFEANIDNIFAGENWLQTISLRNTSSNTWFSFKDNIINITYQWLDQSSGALTENGDKFPLDVWRLNVGQSMRFTMPITAPITPGNYSLKIFLFSNSLGSFELLGFTPLVKNYKIYFYEGIRIFDAMDDRLLTNAGVKSNNKISKSENSNGFLCYGPYIKLGASRYVVKWLGNFSPNNGIINFEISCNFGNIIINSEKLLVHCDSFEMNFELHEAFEGCEFRLLVSGDCTAEFSSLEILDLNK